MTSRDTVSNLLPQCGNGHGIEILPEGNSRLTVIQHNPRGKSLLRGLLELEQAFEIIRGNSRRCLCFDPGYFAPGLQYKIHLYLVLVAEITAFFMATYRKPGSG